MYRYKDILGIVDVFLTELSGDPNIGVVSSCSNCGKVFLLVRFQVNFQRRVHLNHFESATPLGQTHRSPWSMGYPQVQDEFSIVFP
jgi:hypothetical protein